MIRISVTAAGSSKVALFNSYYMGIPQVLVRYALQNVDVSTTPAYTRRTGTLVQGEEAWGKERDKAVSHTTLNADLVWNGSHHIYATDASGYLLRKNAVNYHVNQIFNWANQTYQRNGWRAHPTDAYLYLSDACTGDFRFDADSIRGVFIEYLETTVYRWNGTSMVYQSIEYRKQMTSFYRSSDGSIMKTASTGITANVGLLDGYTNAEINAYMGPTSGGVNISATYDSYGSDPTPELLAQCADDLEANSSFSSLDVSYHPVDFGDLAVECAQQLKYVDSNVFFMLFDIANWRSLHSSVKYLTSSGAWRSLRGLFYAILHGNLGYMSKRAFLDSLKSSANAVLFGKYALLPNVLDVKRLASGAKRFSLFLERQRLHSRRVTSFELAPFSSFEHTAVLTVNCAEYPSQWTDQIQAGIGEMKKWGLYPELVNLQDAIPYSFVLDWFIQWGDFFQDVNQYMDMKWYFPVQYCISSEKWVGSRSSTEVVPVYPVTGTVDTVHYVRWISREVPLPSVSLHAESTAGNHLLESTALILQRL